MVDGWKGLEELSPRAAFALPLGRIAGVQTRTCTFLFSLKPLFPHASKAFEKTSFRERRRGHAARWRKHYYTTGKHIDDGGQLFT